MNQSAKKPNHKVPDLRMQAAEWLLKVQSTEVSAPDLLEWETWLNADPRHRQAFDEAEQVAAAVVQQRDALAHIPLPNDEELDADNYDGVVPIAGQTLPEDRTGKDLVRAKSLWAYALVASVTVLSGAAGLLSIFASFSWHSNDALMMVETAQAEHRSVDLADGSRIDLGAASALSVNYSKERRTVVLEAGEALFEVAKDPDRPFVVVAGSGTITAVGTAFNVRRDADRVVVTVTEGEVAVAHQWAALVPDRSGSAAISPPANVEARLAVGERTAYDTNSMMRLDNVEPAAAATWRQGRLRYRAEPLKHVIPDVDRYSRQTVIIGDAAVGELTFTGTVFQEKADEWLQSLQKVFPIDVVPLDGNRVLLRSRDTIDSE